jgi:hypothetical protein
MAIEDALDLQLKNLGNKDTMIFAEGRNLNVRVKKNLSCPIRRSALKMLNWHLRKASTCSQTAAWRILGQRKL